ncbi:hypothetical protein BAUCODRAFT_118959 [Baudoinia panamericana UAMH 10762]|uniref:Calcineurin-like phosphoesterase domain-containing protein n=1 Tax=Baudoinia panamericana (strain UAMH 10762) TaxID=717646 RepID=M2MW82_BAUPA|nr:uncharacterized protein BAUCODRAFT_118959 [Baudoinia panamericana UAMH 10762]EMD01252.1 hypothetical protein BAUCODRAFT_118959 [Baudoinia panamericana UAMH 10762]
MLNAPATLGEGGTIVATDVNTVFGAGADLPTTDHSWQDKWHRINKDLYLHSCSRTALLIVQQEDAGRDPRAGDICLLRQRYPDATFGQAVSGVDVLFWSDAVDPRPQRTLIQHPLRLDVGPQIPSARLTVRYGKPQPRPTPNALRAKADGIFGIMQVSDTHLVAGVGKCTDAMDAVGHPIPESEADPLTLSLLQEALDVERPDLVVLTGDHLDSADCVDSQSALLNLVATMIKRLNPYAAVFGNHDDEGKHALPMSLLQSLPYRYSQAGPSDVDGVRNPPIPIFRHKPSEYLSATLFLLESHGQIPSKTQTLRKDREKSGSNGSHIAFAFLHIPFPKYGDQELCVCAGHRGEPIESPSYNSHSYDALVREKVAVVSCGHDHVNDFCGLLDAKRDGLQGDKHNRLGPWLCYAGSIGFGAYGSYGGKRYHRRVRPFEIDTRESDVRTWKRTELLSTELTS